jgi:hypothetical protein
MTLRVTHSSTFDLRTCPEKYRLKNVELLVPEHDAEPLRIGTAYHLAREHDLDQAEGRAVLAAVYSKKPPHIAQGKWDAEWVMVRELFDGYHRHNRMEFEILDTERAFDLRVGGLRGVRNSGKIDKVVKLFDGRIAVYEIKTTSEDISAGGDYWDRLRMNSQISRYLDAVPEAETVLYDVTRKPTIRPKQIAKATQHAIVGGGLYLGESVTQADRAYVNDIMEKHDAAEVGSKKKTVAKIKETATLYGLRLRQLIDEDPTRYYRTMEIPRMEVDLVNMRKRIRDDVQEIRWRRRRGAWQRNDAACNNHLGRCPYLDLCARNADTTTVPDGFRRLDNPHPELSS